MAVPTDLINLVLDNYYSKKENHKVPGTDSKDFDSKNSFFESKSYASNAKCTPVDGKKLYDVPKSLKHAENNQTYEDYKQDAYSSEQDAFYVNYPGIEYKSTYNVHKEYAELYEIYPPVVQPIVRPSLSPRFSGPVRPYRMGMRVLARHPPPYPHINGSHIPQPPANFCPSVAHNDEISDRQIKRRYISSKINSSKRRIIDFSYIKELFDHDKLPKELTDQFTRTTCHLCLVTITSPGLMELHYRGKNHLKRVKGWLYKHKTDYKLEDSSIAQMGQLDLPSSMQEVEQEKLLKSTPKDQDMEFCHICNVPLSSQIVAKQHYSGKKHLRNVNQSSKEDNAGYEKPVSSSHRTTNGDINENAKENKWYCHICKVTSTTEEQYEVHLSGKRHKKTWKEYQVVPPVDMQSIALASHQTIPDENDELLADEVANDYDLTLYCPHCKEHFTTRPEFTYHTCSSEDVKRSEHLCKKCKTTFDTRPELKYHDCALDHYCEKCDQYFDKPNQLAEHMCKELNLEGKEKTGSKQVSLQESSFFCSLCRKDLNSSLALESHGKGRLHRVLLSKLRNIHGVSMSFNPFRTIPRVHHYCDKCDIKFKDEIELKAHMNRGEHLNTKKHTTLPKDPVVKDKPELRHSTKPSQLATEDAPVLGSYDIRNLDVNALLSDYYNNK